MSEPTKQSAAASLNRRQLLRSAAAAGVASVVPRARGAAEGKAAVNGRIKQSIAFWCFNSAGEKWDLDKQCRVARTLGCVSVELVDAGQWGLLKKYGLVCA